MLLAKIQVRWKYLENKMGPLHSPQLQDVPSRKSGVARQPVGLDRLRRTEALLPAQSRVPQSLQLLRQLNRLSPQGPAQSPAVPCDPLPRFDKLGLVRLSLSNPSNYQKRGAIALNARPSAASKASTPLIVTKPGGAQRKNHYPKQRPFPRAMWWVC